MTTPKNLVLRKIWTKRPYASFTNRVAQINKRLPHKQTIALIAERLPRQTNDYPHKQTIALKNKR